MTVQPATHVNLHELLPSDVAMRSLNTGETLLAAGELPSAVWLIKSGSIRSLAALPPHAALSVRAGGRVRKQQTEAHVVALEI